MKKILLAAIPFFLFADHGSTTSLYLVRHGQTDWNFDGRLQGQVDIPLNDTGRKEAAHLKKKLHGIAFQACFASDLQRAVETAQILVEPRSLTVNTDARLRERNFGPWEGRTLAEWLQSKDSSSIESDDAVLQRVLSALGKIAKQYADAPVLVVTHGGVLRILLTRLLGLGDSHRSDLKVGNMALLHLSFSNGQCKIEEMHGIQVPESQLAEK